MRSAMLCNALVMRGHDVSWITSTFDHYKKEQRAAADDVHSMGPNFRIVLLRGPGYRSNRSPFRVWHNRSFARSFLSFANRATQRPDIVVTDIPTTEAAQAAVGVASRWGIPSLVSIRDLWPDFFGDFLPLVPKPLLRLAVSGFDRQVSFACRNATAIVGISQQYLEWGLGKGSRQRGALDAVVPLGYSPPVVSAAAEEEALVYLRQRGVSPSKTLITFVGSWGATYDLETVLEAASLLRDRDDVQFVLAGAGEQRDRLLRRIGDQSNVVVPGWLTATQIAVLLERSTLGLAPYRNAAPQGLPNKVFEYMAHGVFQVSTLRGEAAELLTELGVGVPIPTGDPRAMADAILSWHGGAQDHTKRNHIREQFLARFSADVVYSEMAQRIEKLAGVELC